MTGRLHRLLVVAPLLATAVVTPLAVSGSPGQGQGDEQQIAEGRELYLTGCSSCHGPDGEGVETSGGTRGPSLVDAGEAGAYYYLSTGRMPLASSEEQPTRKEPAYTPDEIDALVAYVASLGHGPALPNVDVAQGDLAVVALLVGRRVDREWGRQRGHQQGRGHQPPVEPSDHRSR